MEKLGWFWNNEWRQREKINEAADEINALRAQRSDQTSALTRLFALDQAQAREIDHLRVTLEVLANILIESGAVDEKTLRYRIEAAYANAESIEQPPASKPSAFETLGVSPAPSSDPTEP